MYHRPAASLSELIHDYSYNYERQLSDELAGIESPRQYLSKRSPADKASSSRPAKVASGETTDDGNYNPPSAASFYIPSLPGLSAESTLTLYGGHIPSTVTAAGTGSASSATDSVVVESDAHLFFFLARAKHIAEKQKLILWLNGGPGCSSFDGALMEIGPLRMVEGKRGELYEQEGAWNEYANVLFLDQPAGTGYSYVSKGKYVHSGQEAAEQIINFLSNFYTIFPEYAKMDLYIAGESFAGIWIPYLATSLQKTTLFKPNLKGLLIGNGWMDPYEQYPAYVKFAYDTKLITESSAAAAKVEKALARCENERVTIGKDKFPVNNGACEGVLRSITETTLQTVNGKTLCVNNYDIRLTDTYPACGMSWPPLLPDMYAYLPRKDVVDAFHASAKTQAWAECAGRVSDQFWQSTKPSVHLLPGLLESGIPILLFSGAQDLICNHVGTEKMIENMEWAGQKGFSNQTKDLDWYVDGEKAGVWTTDRNLTYVKVYNASHMVPYDVPVIAHDMLSRFLATDYIAAAGAAATVPSRVGDEQAAIIGETLPNGTALDTVLSSSGQKAGGSEVKSNTAPVTDAYYNVGAAILILLVIIALGAGFVYRQRSKRRLSLGLGGSKSFLPTSVSDGLDSHLHQHRRNRSSASDARYSAVGHSGDQEETNELLAMEKRGGSSSERISPGTASKVDLPRGEELFAVGEEDDEEDSEEEGNLGNPKRRISSSSSDSGDAKQESRGKGYDAV